MQNFGQSNYLPFMASDRFTVLNAVHSVGVVEYYLEVTELKVV